MLKCLKIKRDNYKMNYETIGYVSLFIILIVYFGIFMAGGDMVITYSHSMSFLDCVFSGDWLGFYEYTLEHRVGGMAADYYILQYIVFAIWNLPTWIISRWIIVPEAIALLWCKGILIPFLLGTFQIIKNILKQYNPENDSKFTIFRICSSLCFALPIFTTAQYDIITIFLIFLGIWLCLKEDKITWKVIVIFAIAMPLKLFAIFPYLFILLLKEKRFLYIIRDLLLSFVGLILCIIPFINQPAFHSAMTGNGGWISNMLETVIPGGLTELPIIPICLFALCIIAYKVETNEKKIFLEYIFWINAAFFVVFFTFIKAHSHWSVYLIPFLVLCTRNSEGELKLTLLLECIVNVTLVIVQASQYWWIYFSWQTYSLLMRDVPIVYDLLGINSFSAVLDKYGGREYIPFVYAAFAVAGIALIVQNCPWKMKPKTTSDDQERVTKNWLYLLNTMMLLGYGVITLLITYVV